MVRRPRRCGTPGTIGRKEGEREGVSEEGGRGREGEREIEEEGEERGEGRRTNLDGSLNSSFEPDFVLLVLGSIELVVGLKGHVGEEGRLRSTEVLKSSETEKRERKARRVSFVSFEPLRRYATRFETHVAPTSIQDLPCSSPNRSRRQHCSSSLPPSLDLSTRNSP